MKFSKDPHSATRYLSGIRNHDESVLTEIFRAYFERIRIFILANHGNDQDAEDIFMDALEAIYRQVTKKRLDDLSCSFYTYLFEICKRLWYKNLRRRKRHSGVTPEDLAVLTDDEDPQQALEDTERHGLFWEKFCLLGKDCQQVLTLSIWDKLSAEEIAAEMGYASAGYARKKKHDCREQLLGYIEQDPRFAEVRFS